MYGAFDVVLYFVIIQLFWLLINLLLILSYLTSYNRGRQIVYVSNVGGVTAGQARHNSSNVGGVTAGQLGHNSSLTIIELTHRVCVWQPTPRTADLTVAQIAGYVRIRIHMNR